MRAFHGRTLVKRLTLARAEEFVFNWGGSSFNLPAVFRFTPNADWLGYHKESWTNQPHERNYERARELGISFPLYLLVGIFERLVSPRLYTRRFIIQATPGTDLSQVWPRFALWLMANLRTHASEANPRTKASEEADRYAIELTRSYYMEHYQGIPASEVHSGSVWEQWQTFEGYIQPLMGVPDLLRAHLYRFLHAAMTALMFDAEHSALLTYRANKQAVSETARNIITPICDMVVSAGVLQLLVTPNTPLPEQKVKDAFIHQSEVLLEFVAAAENQEDWISGSAENLLPLLLSYKKNGEQ